MSFDFCFLSSNGQETADPVLVAKNHKKKCLMAVMCSGKSTSSATYSEGIRKRLVGFLDFFGHPRVVLKSDTEEAMTALQERARLLRKQETVLAISKKADSKGNGMIERGIQDIEGEARTLKLHLEHLMGTCIPPGQPIMSWLAEYAAEVINRFREGPDRRTPYERVKGLRRLKLMAQFGESVLWMQDKKEGGQIRQLEPRSQHGIWLGIDPRNDEIIVGTESGIVRARSVKRKTQGPSFEAEKILATR